MIITVASGKGGTGKTTFAVNLAYALANRGNHIRLLDCDVEEPNDHLFVQPEFVDETAVEVMKPVWDEKACTACGKCAEACNYNAIAKVKDKILIFNELCHSCGVCAFVCPEGAICEEPAAIGKVAIAVSDDPFFFAYGMLNIAEPLAPAVVKAVKQHIHPDAINIIDASPGTACPVVEAVDGADVAVLVTEPTPFGLNDLKLAVGLSLEMGVPTGIVINRSDGQDAIIADYADAIDLPILGRIPFSRDYAETYSSGHILVEWHDELRTNLLGIYDNILALKETTAPPVPKEELLEVTAAEPSSFPTDTAQDYREITVISGKGGTGKTTVVGSLAVLAESKVLADNDVDAADLHLLLSPSVRESHDFVGGRKATIDAAECVSCGKCAKACHFNAIRAINNPGKSPDTVYRIDEFACEGCGLCFLVCPAAAITNEPNVTGRWYVSQTEHGPMTHARLGIAQENSGRLVTHVRNRAAQLARELGLPLILGDGPPGTGCPVIASVSGSDMVVIVTEPTVSGSHDMKRVLQLAAHFGVPTVVVINKSDLNMDEAARIDAIVREHGSRVIARIPFDRSVNDALMAGKTVVEYGNGRAEEAIREAWKELLKELQQQHPGN
jgi:MinD superfamily P-loop ATPase